MNGLAGKVAMITGAAAKRSMGRGIAMQLAKDGADIVLIDRAAAPPSVFPEDAGWTGFAQITADITALGRRSLAIEADVSREADVDEAVRKTIERFGTVDILVHCVGIRGPVPVNIVDMDLATWQMMLNINLTGAFLIGRAAARAMLPQRSGKIVMLSSLAGVKAYPGSVAYAATKHGILGLVKTMAAELAPYQITVNAICPGRFNTNFRDNLIREQAGRSGCSLEETCAQDQECPFPVWLGRSGTPEDIAGPVSFLVSDRAAYLTGQTIIVDGGGS